MNGRTMGLYTLFDMAVVHFVFSLYHQPYMYQVDGHFESSTWNDPEMNKKTGTSRQLH